MEQQAIEQIGIGRQAAFTVPFVLSAAGADADTMLATAPLPFRVLHSLTKRRHARLSAMAFGPLTPLAPVATFAAAFNLPGPGKSIINPGISVITISAMSVSKVNLGSGSERSTVMRWTDAAQS